MLDEFGFSLKDELPRLGQFERQQSSTKQRWEGHDDGDDLGDADKLAEDESADDGRQFAGAVQHAERCGPEDRVFNKNEGAEVFGFNFGLMHGLYSTTVHPGFNFNATGKLLRNVWNWILVMKWFFHMNLINLLEAG